MKHKWTDEERSLVRRDYNGTNASARIIASKLSVSVYGVKGQVQRLGLAINKKKTWSPREKEKLVEWFPCYSPSTIARRLKRSVNSVVVKSKKMGLHRKDGTPKGKPPISWGLTSIRFNLGWIMGYWQQADIMGNPRGVCGI